MQWKNVVQYTSHTTLVQYGAALVLLTAPLPCQMLTEDAARNIGLSAYYPLMRKAFNDMLKALDTQFGKPLMMTNTQNVNKVVRHAC